MSTKKEYIALANSVLDEEYKTAYVVIISDGVKEKYNGIDYICSNTGFTSRRWKNLIDDLINSAYRTGGTATAYFYNGDVVSATRDWFFDIVSVEITKQAHTTLFKWIPCETLEEVDNKVGYIGK